MTLTELKEHNVREIIRAPFGDETGRASYYPRYLQIEHSSFCNAACIMCNHFYLGNRGAAHLPAEIVELLKPVYPRAEMIMLNGDGEPFLHPELRNCAALYQKHGVIVSANTNLGAELPNLDDFRYCFDALSLSCDGARKETFEMIRRGISFDVFRENVRRLRKALPETDLTFDVVLMKENVLELSGIVELAAELGVPRVHFNTLGVNPEIGNEADALWDCMDLAVREMRRAARTAAEAGVAAVFPNTFPPSYDAEKAEAQEAAVRSIRFEELIEQRRAQAGKKISGSLSENRLHLQAGPRDYPAKAPEAGAWCSWGLERCYVDLNGNITTCCFNVHHYMGNLREAGSFDAVWNGEAYRAFRRNMRDGVLPYWCGDCSWRRNNAASMAVGKSIPIRKKNFGTPKNAEASGHDGL